MAESMSTRPSEKFMRDAIKRNEKLKKEQDLKDFYEENDKVYVGEQAFNKSWATIQDWINISNLMGYLMKNGLVNNANDMESISSPYLGATQRHTNLNKLLTANGGGCGHFIFYMSLCESLEKNPLGHGDAVDEMMKCAEVCKEQPPWLRTTNRSGYGSYPSSSSSSGFCPTDTSSEMGGQQSLLTMSSLAPPTGNFAPPTSSLTMTTCTSTSSVLSRDNAATSGGSTSTASGQPPQKQPPNSAGNPPGLHQTSCMNPLNQPKLDSAQTSTPRRAENEATPTKAAYNSEKLSKGGAGVNTLASICQPFGGITSTHVLNKQEYTSNECPSYSMGSLSLAEPLQETKRWNDHDRSDSLDSTDTERDGVRRPAQQTDVRGNGESVQMTKADSASSEAGVDKPISRESILVLVVNGDIESLSNKYENVIDFQCTSETNITNFMDEVCRFSCAVLNSRDSKKIGVLIGGVRELAEGPVAYSVEGVKFDDKGRQTIEQQYIRRLMTVLRAQGDGPERQLTPDELKDVVRLEFVDVPRLKENPACSVAVVTVVPSREICKNHMYVCQFRDSDGRPQSECYKRLEGESVHIRQQKKITALKQQLNNCTL